MHLALILGQVLGCIEPYQKIWNGREDNEVAMEQCQGLTYNETLVKLGEIYSNL